MNKKTGSTLLLVVILALLYFLAGKLGLRLAIVHPHVSAVWPPAGLALAACLLLGYRVWPGIFLGAFLVHYTTSPQLFTALAFAAASTLEAVVGTYLVNRFARGAQAFTHSFDIFKFTVLAAIFSTAISPTVGVTSLAVSGSLLGQSALTLWWHGWLGGITAALILTPPLVLWRVQPVETWNLFRGIEAFVILALALMLGLISFLEWRPFGIQSSPIGFAILPVVLWGAFRFGPTGGASTTLLITILAVAGMLQDLQTSNTENLNSAILVIQIFMDTVALASLFLSTVVTERREVAAENARLFREAQALNAELEARVIQRTQALERAQEEAQALSHSLLTVRETERAQMAREIHDELGQQLTLLGFDLGYLQAQLAGEASREVLKRLETMAAQLKETSNMVRNLATQLRPSMLDDLGLLPTLEWQLQEFEARTGITSQLNTTLTELVLAPEVATALFRVCQEALTNVARHAQATAVEITCEMQNDQLVLKIQDNGRGITAQEKVPKHSLGLLGMRERVHLIGGELKINGAAHQGTSLYVNVPWPQAEAG